MHVSVPAADVLPHHKGPFSSVNISNNVSVHFQRELAARAHFGAAKTKGHTASRILLLPNKPPIGTKEIRFSVGRRIRG
jgi:hypothetical protein